MTNNDLISREALKKVITENHYLLSAKNNSTDYGMFTTGIMQAIDNAPTVEGRPHGVWIRTGSLGNGNAQYECSNCHHGDEQAESQEVPYCWHCGAKIRWKETKGGAE